MKLFRSVFGNRAEEYEDKGDDLKLHGYWREAAWFYGRALDTLPAGDERNRPRVAAKAAEARHSTFRRLLDEAEGLSESGRRADALTLLQEAEPFAEDVEEKGILKARLTAWGGGSERDSLVTRLAEDDSGSLPERDSATLVERLQREVVIRPESASAHERLAAALEKEGRPADAIRHYEAAYQRNREKVSLVLEMARVYRESMNDLPAARARLDEACRRHRPTPNSFVLHVERAFHLADEGREHEAVAALGELLAVPGLDNGLILFNRAGLLEKMGRPREAAIDLDKALELSPSNLLYLERLADLIFRTSDDLGRALQYLDRALAASAHDFAVRGRTPGASPDRARLQFKAARILFLLDRNDEARARVHDGLIVCWDPRVEEALIELGRELGS